MWTLYRQNGSRLAQDELRLQHHTLGLNYLTNLTLHSACCAKYLSEHCILCLLALQLGRLLRFFLPFLLLELLDTFLFPFMLLSVVRHYRRSLRAISTSKASSRNCQQEG